MTIIIFLHLNVIIGKKKANNYMKKQDLTNFPAYFESQDGDLVPFASYPIVKKRNQDLIEVHLNNEIFICDFNQLEIYKIWLTTQENKTK